MSHAKPEIRGEHTSGPPPIATVVVKLGGRACEAPGALRDLAAELASTSRPMVVVHGGGAEVTTWCERLGIPTRFERGLRVTDPATLSVAAAVLAGVVNKSLVATLRASQVDAIGLAVLDGGLCDVVPHPQAAALGEVGAVRTTHPALLESLLAQGRTPVLASIGDWQGRLLNLNADDVAAAIAGALRARTLVLLSDTPGLRLEGQVVPRLDPASVSRALAHPDVQGGMAAKLAAAQAALEAGASRVVIGAWNGPGTLQALIEGRGECTVIESPAREEALHG